MDNNGLKLKILYLFQILLLSFYNGNTRHKEQNTIVHYPPYRIDLTEEGISKFINSNKLINKYIPSIKPKEEDVEVEEVVIEVEENPVTKKINELKNITGLNVVGYEKHVFEISFYSDLNCENGFGNITATGKTLKDGMIANNFLNFGTKVYIDGLGLKTVEDRGSKKYFNAVNKADVFIHRNYGESDKEYYRRVNNLGRKHIDGYILHIEE